MMWMKLSASFSSSSSKRNTDPMETTLKLGSITVDVVKKDIKNVDSHLAFGWINAEVDSPYRANTQ